MYRYTRRNFPSVPGIRLKQVTYRLDTETIKWVKMYAKACGVSQGALINAVLADFMTRKVMPDTDPERVEELKTYAGIILARAPRLRFP